VWRDKLRTQYRSMAPEEVEVMRGVKENDNFARLCERLTELDIDPAQVPLRAAGILKTWLTQGMISGFLFD
jgi:hypothetical protein